MAHLLKDGEEAVSLFALADLHITLADDEIAKAARAAFRKAAERQDDLVVIAGDLVDDVADQWMDNATRMISQELGDRPVLAVPGNHDVIPDGFVVLGGPLGSGGEQTRQKLLDLSRHVKGRKPLGPPGNPWPLRIELAGGRCVVFGLDSMAGITTGGAVARGCLGEQQIECLDASLSKLSRDQKSILVLHHHVLALPSGRGAKNLLQGDWGMGLDDKRDLRRVIVERKVSLVIHGHRHHHLRRRIGTTPIVACSSATKGCGLTGQRFGLAVRLGLRSGQIEIERIHHASPEKRSLGQVFDNVESMNKWLEFAQNSWTAEDTFTAFARGFQDREARLGILDGLAERIDQDLLGLLRPPGDRAQSLLWTLMETARQEGELQLEEEQA